MVDPLRPFTPGAERPFDLRLAGHLARRAGFGAALAERERMVADGLAGSLRRWLTPHDDARLDDAMADALALGGIGRVRALRVHRMLHARFALRERMTLLWHGHFATGNQKVANERQMALQMATLDARGLGRFDDLLLAVARDPAMVRWLDNDRNVVGNPNENFARELFELFALGLGNYGERDVREAARAFTGWTVQHERFRFAPSRHDGGSKEVLGRRGRLSGEDVIAITAARPQSARFVCGRLLRWFVHPQPTDAEVDALAEVYRGCHRHVGRTLDVLLRSELFFSERAYRSRIKSPLDLAVGTVRALGASASPARLADAATRMGQTLLEPPSVEGWHQERAWINSATWLARSNFLATLFEGGARLRPAADALLADARGAAARADLALRILLDGDVSLAGRDAVRRVAEAGDDAAAILHAASCLPEGHLL